MALSREHVRCLALPSAQLPEPQVLARRPAHPAARPARRALNVLCAARVFYRRGGRRRRRSASSPERCAHILHWLRVLDDCCRSNSTICLPFAVYVRIGADSRAAMRVCVAGGGALALRDLSIGRTFSPIDHPMAVGLGPIDSRLAELVVRNTAMIVSRFCSHFRSQQ